MKKVPIAFCFDDNLVLQAGVCLTSLLENAKPTTFYDIYIIHDKKAKYPQNRFLNKLSKYYSNHSITYRIVGDTFKDAFQIRGITQATYFRLLIPELVTEYDKIMYHDVDVIFRDDLSEVFFNTDMSDIYVAGVSTPYSDIEEYMQTIIGVSSEEYIAAGNIIMNSELLLKDNIISRFKKVAETSWKYQDMDVINLVCKGRIKYLPPSFCMVGTTTEILSDNNQTYYSKGEAEYALKYGTIHYNGTKPWDTWCLNFDIWWEYYRKSIFFDPKYYLRFYKSKISEYDNLSLWKRVKILLRYFRTFHR